MNLLVQFKSFSNLTTGVDYFKKDPSNIKITQYGEESLEVEIGPNNSLAQGNKIIGSIYLKTTHSEILFDFTGKVLEFTHTESSDKIVIKLIQYNSETWTQFLHALSEVQIEVMDLLKRIKGY